MSAKIPKGWRVMRDGEVTQTGDGIAFADGLLIIKKGAAIGHVCRYEQFSDNPFVRRIKPASHARPHRFDGMTLDEALREIYVSRQNGKRCGSVAVAFAREVRRRDAKKGAK